MIEHIIKLEAAFKLSLADAYQAMKKAGIVPEAEVSALGASVDLSN